MMTQRNQHLLHENESNVCQEWFLLKLPLLSLSRATSVQFCLLEHKPNAQCTLLSPEMGAAGSGMEAPLMVFASLLLWFAHRRTLRTLVLNFR